MDYAAPVIRWITVLTLLVCLRAGLPFGPPATAESGNGLASVNLYPGLILNCHYANRIDLLKKYQGIDKVGVLIGDAPVVSDGVLIGDPAPLSSKLFLWDNPMMSSVVLIQQLT